MLEAGLIFELVYYFAFVLILGLIWLKVAGKAGIKEFVKLDRFNKKVKEHFRAKEGTVTLGGIIILIGLWIFVLFNQTTGYFTIAGIASMLFLFGAFDDIAKIIGKNGSGNSLFTKMLLHFIVGALFCLIFYLNVARGIFVYWIFTSLFFVYFVNAVNITDGLNGMAAGNFIIVLAFVSIGFWHYSNLEMLKLSLILIGMCIAFFAFNINGKMFMGDAGASMLGGILAMIAIFGKLKMLVFVAGMFIVLDGASSFIQVFGRKILGRRILPFACPIHHHYINKGTGERKIVVLSWIFSIIMGMIGLWIIW